METDPVVMGGVEKPDPESLERRPEARAFKVEDLLAKLRLGKVRIPSFQRRLKWDRGDARKLVDSLYRGYPVGTLLFWENRAEPDEIRFGTVHVSAGARTDALWVVDGQQRIVSLARVLLAPESEVDEFALYFDLEQRQIVPPPLPAERTADLARWLPMTEVLDAEKLRQWAYGNLEKAPERRERAFQLGRRIREYEIPAYLVRTDNEATLREVFGRINSAGKRLEASEVFDALHGARTHSRPATIPQIVTELERLDFGRVEEKILYRLLRVLLGADVTERSGAGPPWLSRPVAEQAYRHTAEVAERVVQFVKNDVGIPHYELLPYKQPMVTLGKFFDHHPDPKPRSRDLLVRWVWRGALNGAHRGDTVLMRRTLEGIVANAEEESVQRMLGMVGTRPPGWPDVAGRFNFRHATAKLLALALTDLNPRDLESGALLRLEDYLGRTDQELPFPALVSSSAVGPNMLLLSVANRLAHPYRTGLRRRLIAVTDRAVLASHGITEEAHAALRAGEAARFLALRAEYLGVHVRAFCERHARWDEPDRPSISSLLVADEEE